MSVLISVITPVYNTEKYLIRCVDSIVGQTYNDIEIILVDDGSSDKSGSICDKYALGDSRVRVVHKKNGGVSSARNAGISLSKGKYICFVDSDDWLEQDYFSLVSGVLLKQDVFLLLNNYIRDFGAGYVCEVFEKHESFERNTSAALLDLMKTKYFVWAPFATFYEANICKRIKFEEDICFGEDLLFKYMFVKEMEKSGELVFYSPIARYHYNVSRFDSASNSYAIDKKIDELKVKSYIVEEENNEIGNTMLTSALIFNLINYLKYLVKRTDFVGKENAKFVRGLIRKHLFRVMMANEVTIILKVKLAICLLPDFMLKSFFECYKSCKRRV